MNPLLFEHYVALLSAAKSIGTAIYNGVHGLVSAEVTNEDLDKILAATQTKAEGNAADARERASHLG